MMLSPIRSRWPARRACQFVHRLLKFLNNCDATTASPVAMAGMIKSSIHHFDGFVGLADNGGGSGKDGGRAAICGGLLVGAGIGTVETTFGVMSTVSVGGGTGGAGGGLSPGSGRVTTGGDDCLAHCNRSLERPGLPWYQHRLESTIRYDHHLPSWPGDDWHSVALAPELISSSTTAMNELALVMRLGMQGSNGDFSMPG